MDGLNQQVSRIAAWVSQRRITVQAFPGMAFSTAPEVRTFAALNGALAPLGYSVSQKARVLDCVRAAAEYPEATRPVGPTLADQLIPALRAAAGPFGPTHPWLRPGDWRYAFAAHFDFVIHEGIVGEYPTHPLFAVEFDGAGVHARPAARRRDLAKNRLCAASGLPLVRIDATFLHRRERLSLIEWLAKLWAAYRAEMPQLLVARDAAVQAMPEEQLAAAGWFLLGEYPALDVDWIFQLDHPFPPAREVAERLAARYGFHWSEVAIRPTALFRQRWKVTSSFPPTPALNDRLIERWRCQLSLTGPAGQTTTVQGIANVQSGYPLDEGLVADSWDALLAGRLAYLPAGPWTTAPSVLGKALCIHNTLVEVEHYLRRNDQQ
jgi:hypothetical protein